MSRLHRFYTGDEVKLTHDFWLQDKRLLWQWSKVLRFQAGQEVILFNGVGRDRLYRIEAITPDAAHLQHVTDLVRQVPERDVYLFWALLKKDKNDWVLQKCTELGVSHFVPLLSERSEKQDLNPERAEKIVIEAAEQCGRSDVPNIREPMLLESVLREYAGKVPLYVCEQASGGRADKDIPDEFGLLVGPEGGWSEREKKVFQEHELKHVGLHKFTLRAETASVAAAALLIQ